MNQVEKNTIKSFDLAKQDIHALREELVKVIQRQRAILSELSELRHRKPVVINKTVTAKKIAQKSANPRTKTVYIAAKNGKKYHQKKCPFAQNIMPKNRIKFASRVKALNQGFKPCNCIN